MALSYIYYYAMGVGGTLIAFAITVNKKRFGRNVGEEEEGKTLSSMGALSKTLTPHAYAALA